ncbi:hypothetical protein [Geminisphaera colitermitum]|nr:hypothetical protein [Geminisphaera colitermitum]
MTRLRPLPIRSRQTTNMKLTGTPALVTLPGLAAVVVVVVVPVARREGFC